MRGRIRKGASGRARVPLAPLSGVGGRKALCRSYRSELAPRTRLLCDTRSADGSASGLLEAMSPGMEEAASGGPSMLRELARVRVPVPFALIFSASTRSVTQKEASSSSKCQFMLPGLLYRKDCSESSAIRPFLFL